MRFAAIDDAGRVADPSVIDLAKVAEAMEREWREAEIRPPLGLERAIAHGDELHVEHWASGMQTLHKVTVRGPEIRAAIASWPSDDDWSEEDDPNDDVADWLLGMIEEELDSSGPWPTDLVLDPETGSFSH
jgi:hypothetical protein